MENKVSKLSRHIFTGSFVLIASANRTWVVSAQAVERVAVGINPAAIQSAVDQFRADLGQVSRQV
jgi:hypothetical protein